MLSGLTSLLESLATSITTEASVVYHGPLVGKMIFKFAVLTDRGREEGEELGIL